MANLPKLEELTQNQLQMLQEACSSFFPVEILGEGYKGSEVTEFSIAELGLNWKSRENFLVDILRITDQKDIRSANKILDKYAGEAPKEAGRPESQTQTTPANREELEQERLIRETSEKQAWARAKEDIERSKQRLEEIQVEKDKKLHVKVTSKEEVKFTEDEQKVYENYKDYSKQKPQQAVEELSQEIKNRVGEDLKAQGFTDEEIKVAATGTATQLVENFTQSDDPNYVPQTYHTAVLAHVAQNNQLAGSQVSESAKNVATDHLLQYQMYKDITKSAFGKYFADENFGIDADKLDVSFSEAPQAGGMTFTPYEVVRSNQSILEERSQTLDTVREFGVDRAKGILLNRAGSALEQRIALLTPNSAAGKLLQSMEAKSLLFSTFGVGAPIKWEATNLIGRLALKSGYAPVVSAFGKLTGINTGLVGSISTGVAKQTLGKVAAKTGIKAAISTTLASVGISIPVPILNFIAAAVGWLVGEVFGKLIEKYGPQIKKFFKEVLGPLLLVGGGFLLGVPALGLAAGGLAFGVARGLTLAGIGAGIWNFFRTLGGAFAMTIATPIIVTLLVLPPLVAFIMLVINSGAFIVPQSVSYVSDNPYMAVTKTAEPNKYDNPSPKVTITYTVTITALKNNLTDVQITNVECDVIKKDGSKLDCPPENIPEIPSDLVISPSSSYSFTFTADYDSKFADSLVFDSIEVTANYAKGKGITASGSASVCFGDCPVSCVKVSDNAQEWPSNLRVNSEKAVGELSSKYISYMAKVCKNNEEVNLCFNPPKIDSGYFAWHIHNLFNDGCDVYFNEKGVGNSKDALFLITHELTHHIQKVDGSSIVQYLSSGAFAELNGKGFCTYKDTAESDTESMAEALGLYASIPSWGQCVSNYKNQYPKNYTFAKDFME